LQGTIWRAFGAAGIPAVKEQDGKRLDGLTLIPWQGGRSLVWDVTAVSPLAASYVDSGRRRWRSGRYNSFQEETEILSVFSVHA